MERPIGVTILTFVAVVLAFLNAIVMLRFLGFLPFLGPIGHPYFQPLVCTIVRPACLYMGMAGSDALAGGPAGLDVSGCYYDIQSVRGFCGAGYRRFMV